MVGEEIVDNSAEILSGVVIEIGKIGNWLQALGVIIILWIIFNIVSLIINRKKEKTLDSIKLDLKRLERKVDRLTKSKK